MSACSDRSWWKGWAPYWALLEDRHLGRRAARLLLPHIEGPVLVVGAGQGVAVEALRAAGVSARALDRDLEMARHGRRRRGLDFEVADGAALPYRDGAFATALLSSGVADHGVSPAGREALLAEAERVVAPGGRVLAAFFRLPAELEALYRRLGVVDREGYHLGRLFAIGETARRRPLRCIAPIARWSGASRLATALFWLRVGLARPRAFAAEEAAVEAVFAAAARDGVPRERLIETVPRLVPLWDAASVSRALAAGGRRARTLVEAEDCIVALLDDAGSRTGG